MLRPIHEVIRAAPRTAESEEADWRGLTPRAQFEAAARRVQENKTRRAFGRRNVRG
jgi:hypothetical protein